MLIATFAITTSICFTKCRCGGIGRRKGLKSLGGNTIPVPYDQLDEEALGHNELDIKVRLKCIPSTVVDR